MNDSSNVRNAIENVAAQMTFKRSVSTRGRGSSRAHRARGGVGRGGFRGVARRPMHRTYRNRSLIVNDEQASSVAPEQNVTSASSRQAIETQSAVDNSSISSASQKPILTFSRSAPSSRTAPPIRSRKRVQASSNRRAKNTKSVSTTTTTRQLVRLGDTDYAASRTANGHRTLTVAKKSSASAAE